MPRSPTTADRSALRVADFLRFSTSGRAFHSASSRLPLSWLHAFLVSSGDNFASLTTAGGSRRE